MNDLYPRRWTRSTAHRRGALLPSRRWAVIAVVEALERPLRVPAAGERLRFWRSVQLDSRR